jgi:hypothetical protein
MVTNDKHAAHRAANGRPEPWRPVLSTDVVVEKPKCLGDLVRERAEAEGRIGSETIGTPGDGDHDLVESWYSRHPEKLPNDAVMMTKAARKVEEKRRRDGTSAAPIKRRHKRSGYMRDYHRRRKETKAKRIVVEGATGWNNRYPRRKHKPTLHHRAQLLPRPKDPSRRGAPDKLLPRFATK